MIVVMTVIIMGMGMAAILNRNQIDLPEMHTPLGHGLGRQLAHSIRVAPQQGHFHAMVVIKPRAHGRNSQIMMLMLRAVEPHGE